MTSSATIQLPQPTAILWDLDGTLIDQTAAIIRCYREVILDMGYPQPDDNSIRRSLGGIMAATMALFVEAERLDEACKAFRVRFPKIMFDGLILLAGGEELIERAIKHTSRKCSSLTNMVRPHAKSVAMRVLRNIFPSALAVRTRSGKSLNSHSHSMCSTI